VRGLESDRRAFVLAQRLPLRAVAHPDRGRALVQLLVDGLHPLSIPLSKAAVAPPAEATDEPAHRQAARQVWAQLLARICEVLPLLCPRYGGAMRIIACITGAAVIQALLGHLGEPKSPPRLRPARGPPLWETQDRGSAAINPQAQPMPDHEFDRRVAWSGTRP